MPMLANSMPRSVNDSSSSDDAAEELSELAELTVTGEAAVFAASLGAVGSTALGVEVSSFPSLVASDDFDFSSTVCEVG